MKKSFKLTQKSELRVVQMMLSTQPGGAETFFEKLSSAFSLTGMKQCLIIEPNEELEVLLSSLKNVEVVLIRFGGLREPFAKRKLRKVFYTFRPDIAMTWMNRASRRVPSGFCPVVGRLGGYYKLRHYTHCSNLVGITPDLVEYINSSGRGREEVHLIPNFGEIGIGSDIDEESRESLRESFGLAQGEVALLALGRLHEVKAHDTLIRACAGLKQNYRLLIAGEGPLRKELMALVNELGLTSRVEFLGWRRDVGRLYKACDISVFPSRYEPNGTVVMESWAHRIPLIASRAKGPEWLVDHGENGLLFDIDNVDQLRACMSKLILSADLRNHLVTMGSKKWSREFSQDVVVSKYLDLFEQLSS